MSEVKRRLTPEDAERVRWRTKQAMRGIVFVVDDPADPMECPVLTLTAWSAVRMPSAYLPWKQSRGNA